MPAAARTGDRARARDDAGDAATVAAFLAGKADREYRPVTITRRDPRTAPPTTPTPVTLAPRTLMSGIRRQLGTEVRRQATPLELEPLARVIEPISITTLQALRDRAQLLLGFAATFRRSELVALDVEDLCFNPVRGLTVRISSPRPTRSRQSRGRRPVRAREITYAPSTRSAAGSRPLASAAAPPSAGCAAATRSPTSDSPTKPSR